MIILKTIGGLGNQMFQIAYAYSISQKTNKKIYIDESSYKNYKIRNFSLIHLKIYSITNRFEKNSVSKLFYLKMKISQKLYRIFQKILKIISGKDIIGKKIFNFLSEKGLIYNFDIYHYDLEKMGTKENVIYGYYQSEKYFEEYREDLKKLLKVSTPLEFEEAKILDEIDKSNSIGVSIRIGKDYTENGYFNVCSKDYYYRAMRYLKEKNPESTFYIFSDDIDLVKNEFQFNHDVKFIDKKFTDYQSLRLLYSCKHFVVSNSSFSWWGAYLSENPNKIIVAPERWYNNSFNKAAIYLDDMILIEVD